MTTTTWRRLIGKIPDATLDRLLAFFPNIRRSGSPPVAFGSVADQLGWIERVHTRLGGAATKNADTIADLVDLVGSLPRNMQKRALDQIDSWSKADLAVFVEMRRVLERSGAGSSADYLRWFMRGTIERGSATSKSSDVLIDGYLNLPALARRHPAFKRPLTASRLREFRERLTRPGDGVPGAAPLGRPNCSTASGAGCGW